jgi:hypothetical protein
MTTELSTCTWYKPCKWSKWVDVAKRETRRNLPVTIQEKITTCCGKKHTRIVEPY